LIGITGKICTAGPKVHVLECQYKPTKPNSGLILVIIDVIGFVGLYVI